MKLIVVVSLAVVLVLISLIGVNCDSNVNGDGNEDSYADTTPPIISEVSASDITETSAHITWITDTPATTQVEYGLTTDYGLTTTVDEDLGNIHGVVLTGFSPATTYYFQVKSRDASGNVAVLDNQTLTTLGAADSGAPVIPGTVTSGSEEVRQAEQVAQGRLNRMADITYADWKGASAVAPQPCYDLQGRLISYMFSVDKDGKFIGHIHLGSSLYNYALIEAGTAPPPSIPTNIQVEAILNRDLGLALSQKDISEDVSLLFTGGAKGLYAKYETNGRIIGLNLYSKSAVLVSELRPTLPSPEEYEALMEEAIASRPEGRDSSGYKAIPMDCLYDIYWDHEEGCGPATGVMIAAYYRQIGYDNFPYSNPPYNDDLNAAYDHLHEEMMGGWWSWGTAPWDYGSGFVDYAEDKGYDNFDSYRLPVNEDHRYYWQVTEYIDGGYPLAGLYPWHYLAVRGYDYNEGNYYDLICNNPDSGYGYGGVQWMGWWAYEWFNMIAITD